METDMLHSAAHALLIILDPTRLMYLFGGVCMGLSARHSARHWRHRRHGAAIAVHLQSRSADGLRAALGLGATTTTADPIAAILFGAPGHAASAATTLDGYPMSPAWRGRPRARRLLHGRPDRRTVRRVADGGRAADPAPDHPLYRLAGAAGVAVFGISMVAVLSGNAPAARAHLRVLRHDAGHDRNRSQTGTLRWTLRRASYLWEGLPLVPMTLGVFCVAGALRPPGRPHCGSSSKA